MVWRARSSPQALLDAARDALRRGRSQVALSLAEEAVGADPGSVAALLTASQAAEAAGELARAAEFCGRAANLSEHQAGRLLRRQGELCLKLQQATNAEKLFHEALVRDPQDIAAHQQLADLLIAEGRFRDAIPHTLRVVRHGLLPMQYLVLLGYSELILEDANQIPRFAESFPGDVAPLLNRARLAVDTHQVQEAEALLVQVTDAAPRLQEPQIWLGRLLLDRENRAQFLRWHERLPQEIDQHPGIWMLRGEWLMLSGLNHSAARCFWEAMRRNPNERQAGDRLSRMLTLLGHPSDAIPFREHEQRQAALIDLLDTVTSRPDPGLLRRTVELLESLGRWTEAWAWCQIAVKIDPRADWAVDRIRELNPRIRADAPQADPDLNPANRIDLQFLPLPDWHRLPSEPQSMSLPPSGNAAAAGVLLFRDDAPTSGLNFSYFNGADIDRQTGRMYEFVGGGVAVGDFDGDGWPDTFLSQGCLWPAGSPPDPAGSQKHESDRLFRNTGGSGFQDVTALAGVGDTDFSTGCTVGDMDGDGFCDLLVGNIGANRCCHNNGDGTLSDVTQVTGVAGNEWTSSCLLADLSGDGLPEIYVVNYLQGIDVFSRTCTDVATGIVEYCPPGQFAAAQDRLYLNEANGHFRDVTSESGIEVSGGKGLGIVAADLRGFGQLDLFVANDGTANFYFRSQTPANGQAVRFEESGLEAGLAFDAAGSAQACMGVAADDADGDGLLDLFVTNFSNESNTLYRQIPGHAFVDASRTSGLAEPSFALLGFGTQFLDADLDGHPELIVANGNIGDYAHRGIPWRMLPQLFRNTGSGHFSEVTSPTPGAYFQQPNLGRGLARIDWNRDGLEDVVVSHLHAPVALLTNHTASAGHFLCVRLRGVSSARDAIGTTVTVSCGSRTRVRQLTAGDGYQAANERLLVFGLGAATKADQLLVRWPSGRTETYADIPANSELLLIEGRSAWFRLTP